MIISVNNNQYKSSCLGLLKLKNTTVKTTNIIIGKVICFKCENEIVYNNANSKWLALIKPVGQIKEKTLLGTKFKRRKTYKKTVNIKPLNTLVQITKVLNTHTTK
ncbi:hypothetical protein AADW59_00030 [Candidatus Hodgkinia cicadicola]